VNLDCLAILPHFNNPWNLTQTGQAEPGNAADALAAGLRLDFRWPAFGDDLATVDDRDAIGQRRPPQGSAW